MKVPLYLTLYHQSNKTLKSNYTLKSYLIMTTDFSVRLSILRKPTEGKPFRRIINVVPDDDGNSVVFSLGPDIHNVRLLKKCGMSTKGKLSGSLVFTEHDGNRRNIQIVEMSKRKKKGSDDYILQMTSNTDGIYKLPWEFAEQLLGPEFVSFL